ncbi:hypothetical protein [uncultured Imperialibacter sp.]|uniref:hypothetical protein n=1 Tax=uncultured Imperialibacter sp. TaxID=1672639 RepID=UPI0030DC4363|tara:strand:+ start:6602 stop:7573 length:972 start_codon:yes stop_codon:yes gene_type:complete
MTKKQIVYLFLVFLKLPLEANAQERPKNLRDSLLQQFTIEELKKMSTDEMWEEVRRMRGFPPKETSEVGASKLDENGVPIIRNFPRQNLVPKIEKIVQEIDEEKQSYFQEIYPNNWVDIISTNFQQFYQDWRKREVKEEFRNLLNINSDTTIYSNISKRVYYFSKQGELRLISIVYGFNINTGNKWGWEDKVPYQYDERHYYVWNDSLIYFKQIEAKQYYDTEPSMYNLVTIDTADVHVTRRVSYFYRNQGFDLYFNRGQFKRWDWRDKLAEMPNEYKEVGNSYQVIVFRNLLLERNEYFREENDYLFPVPGSFLEPYVIESK